MYLSFYWKKKKRLIITLLAKMCLKNSSLPLNYLVVYYTIVQIFLQVSAICRCFKGMMYLLTEDCF